MKIVSVSFHQQRISYSCICSLHPIPCIISFCYLSFFYNLLFSLSISESIFKCQITQNLLDFVYIENCFENKAWKKIVSIQIPILSFKSIPLSVHFFYLDNFTTTPSFWELVYIGMGILILVKSQQLDK